MADNILKEGIKLYNEGSYSDALAFFFLFLLMLL